MVSQFVAWRKPMEVTDIERALDIERDLDGERALDGEGDPAGISDRRGAATPPLTTNDERRIS